MPDSEIKNVLSLKSYYAQLHFGISAAKSEIPVSCLTDCVSQDGFSAASLLKDQLDGLSPENLGDVQKHCPLIHAGAAFDRSMTDQIFCSGRTIRMEFASSCRKLLTELSCMGIHSLLLDLSLFPVMNDPVLHERFQMFLQEIQPVLLKEDSFLLLPYRLPSREEITPEQFSLFLRKLMIANVRVLFEIYPHELLPDFEPEILAGTLRLAAGEVCFCYNADCGNRLVRAHFQKFLKYFALTGFKGPFLAAPLSRNPEQFRVEAQAFSGLVREFLPKQRSVPLP